MEHPLAPKQLEFILNSNAHWNLAHGAVRSGKTIATLFRFLLAANEIDDPEIWIVGHTSETVFHNIIRLIFEREEFKLFKPFCSWEKGKRNLHFKNKIISTLGAKDAGAIGQFQGKTFALVLCDEITLYPPQIIDMIDTRLSKPNSKGFATMNPTYPSHKVKQWIDKADAGDPKYYALHYQLADNPYISQDYIDRLRNSLSGVFYKRNFLGLWCLAEGAIFDFFDREIYVLKRPPRAAEYWVVGIDYGINNNFACVLIGVSTGRYGQLGPMMWAEKEYVWDSHMQQRQKTNSELANDVEKFLQNYSVMGVYLDPSAASFRLELQRKGIPIFDTNNDVLDGIASVADQLKAGSLYICEDCPTLISEMEGYTWDSKAAEKGEDRPVKKNDHCIDALRYPIHTHKPVVFDHINYTRSMKDYRSNRFEFKSNFY